MSEHWTPQSGDVAYYEDSVPGGYPYRVTVVWRHRDPAQGWFNVVGTMRPIDVTGKTLHLLVRDGLVVDHEAQIRDLLEEREELLTEIRRLRMGRHPAGRALLPGFPSALPKGATDADVIALREALAERDAEHEGGEGA